MGARARKLVFTLISNCLLGGLLVTTTLFVLGCVIAISNWLVGSFWHDWKNRCSELESDFERERACYPRKKSAREKIMKMADPLTYLQDASGNGNGNGSPKLTHLLFTKINEPRESHDRVPEMGREHILEFTCKICSKGFLDGSNNKTSSWVTVVPDCLHMCHAECVPQWMKYRTGCCPSCGHLVEKEDLKEVLITVNPL